METLQNNNINNLNNNNERIIPIKILNSSHGNKKTIESPTATTTQQNLLVTHVDGSTSEIQGTVTDLSRLNNNNNNNNNHTLDNKFNIQEIGQETLDRETSKLHRKNVESVQSPPPVDNSTKLVESEKPKSRHSSTASSKKSEPEVHVRHVPIRLNDGKIIQRDPEETMEIRSEFSNVSHEKIRHSPDSAEHQAKKDHLARPTSPPPPPPQQQTTTTSQQQPEMKQPTPKQHTPKERIIPIRLEDGQEIFPTFTSLDDPEPPNWSTFSKTNMDHHKSPAPKEKIIPLRLDVGDDADNASTDRSRRRTKSSSDDGILFDETRRSSRSSDRKPHSVRFNVKEETTETRSESRESYSRKSTTRSSGPRSKPPSGPSDRHSYTSGLANRRPGYGTASGTSGGPRSESPAPPRRDYSSDSDQKTLMDIDRDITRIWKELQELDSTTTPKVRRPVTPVKIKSYTIPTPERVCRTPPPPLSSSLPPSSTPRTIWDMDSGSSFTPQVSRANIGSKNDSKINGAATNGRVIPFADENLTAPLATSETSPSSPSSKFVDMKSSPKSVDKETCIEDDVYEGVDFRQSTKPSSKSRKSESPKKEISISAEDRHLDKSTQTGEEKKRRKSHCNIA